VDMGIVSNLRTYRGKVINESLKQLKTTYWHHLKQPEK
jgi:hypothetical protein